MVGKLVKYVTEGEDMTQSQSSMQRSYVLTDAGLRTLSSLKQSQRKSNQWIANKALIREVATVDKIFRQGLDSGRRSGSNEDYIQAVFNALGAGEPRKGFDYILHQSLDKSSPKVIILSNIRNCSCTSELLEFLDGNRCVVWVTESLLGEVQRASEQDHQKPEAYDCFLLLKSAESKAETFSEEIDLINRLQNEQLDKKLTLAVIHVESALCLPLDHPLNQKLKDVPQWQWSSSITKEVSQNLQSLLQTINSSPSVTEWTSLLRTISQMNSSANWLVAYAGENQMDQFKMLADDLGNETDRRVQSRYSYWGLGPAYMWDAACRNPTYHMKENLDRFPSFARPLSLSQHFDRTRYNFVSLGAGEGTKDKDVIKDFFNERGCDQPRTDFLYIAVDMSLDLLRLAIEKIRLPLHSCIAIQRDIETPVGIGEVAFISKLLGQQKPILYGLIGNTISNVQNPHDVMKNIASVMRDDDLLLFEAQIINPKALEENYEETSRRIKNEYKNDAFLRFAESALLQYTDLPMTSDERRDAYDVDVFPQNPLNGSRLIRIDCFFINRRSENINLRLMNNAHVTWRPGEHIYIYRSHKFTPEALKELVQVNGFEIFDSSPYLSPTQTGFMVMLLHRKPLIA